MSVGEVCVMGGGHYFVLVISLSCQKLMLGCCFKMMGSGAMVFNKVV